MSLSRFRRMHLAARAGTASAVSLLLAGCPAGSDDGPSFAASGSPSGQRLENAASRFTLPLSPPVLISSPRDDGLDPPVIETASGDLPLVSRPGTSTVGPTGSGPSSLDPPVAEPPVQNPPAVQPPAGETVLDRLQTRFRSEDDADFWVCFVFEPRTTVLAYNFVGAIGATAIQPSDADTEPDVQTYVAVVTEPDTVMLDFTDIGEAEVLSQIVITGSGSGAVMSLFSSTWGELDCSIANSGDDL